MASNCFKLLDFQIIDRTEAGSVFHMRFFGINEDRETCSIYIKDFKPFVYIKIGDNWNDSNVSQFMSNLKDSLGNYKFNIVSYEKVYHKTLYDFDNGKKHCFLKIYCKNSTTINKIRDQYYESNSQQLIDGLDMNGEDTFIYESQVPPMLRYFHIQEISPSGWIFLKKTYRVSKKETTCKYEYNIKSSDIQSMPEKEIMVPYKICSFDIEASSSHGDFPLPQKNYSSVAYQIVHNFIENKISRDEAESHFKNLLYCVFGFSNDLNIDTIFLKNPYNLSLFETDYIKILNIKESILKNKKIAKYRIDELLNITSKDDKRGLYYNSYKKGEILDMLCDNDYDKNQKIITLTDEFNKVFPSIKGDKVTFIGSTFINAGEEKPYLNNCIVLDENDIGITELDVKNSELEVYDTEEEVLCNWANLIQREDPDIIIGYNIFGFDYSFMFKRAIETGCVKEFLKLSRVKDEVCCDTDKAGNLKLKEMKVILASGDYDLEYVSMTGRLQIDLLIYMRKDSGFSFTSFKLDSVAGELISDKVSKTEIIDNKTLIYTKNQKGLEKHSFVSFDIINHTNEPYNDGEKFKILDLQKDYFVINKEIDLNNFKVKWGLAKDDVTAQDIFRMTDEGPEERALIAKYCIQDCNLVHQLFQKLDILTAFIEMSKLSSVPMSFLMFRGQGIKLTSYIAKKCREKDTLMPLISKGSSEDAYEGALVLEPKCDIYLDDPVACVDYSSLYPSSMISENISQDSKVWTKTYNMDDRLVNETGEKDENDNYIYDNLPGFKYVDIQFDIYKKVPGPTKASADLKVLDGYKICRYAQFNNGRAILPSILEELLAARSKTKKQMKKETDPFMKNILDKRQLSIKVTANSVYGQTGAKTSTFYDLDVAACTTAIGRKLLIYGQKVIENVYKNKICNTQCHGEVITNASYVYGDTDSVFFKFNLTDLQKNPIIGKKALEITIELAKEAGEIATKFLKGPHDLEYEKTYLPFALLSKKRYVGVLFEEDVNVSYRKSMGLVLKRRDNAPIVKDIYGGIIDILLNERSIEKAKEFLKTSLQNILDEKINLQRLIITKSLRNFYKNPQQIAHKVLADRMGERDPGNKPSSGDRIPFVYIIKKGAKLQGEKIEHPDYVKEHNLKIDYGFYISNQIMKPVLQLFALVLYDMPEFKRKKESFIDKLETLKSSLSDEKYLKKEEDLKTKEVQKILFDEYLIKSQNMKNNNSKSIASYFK